MTIVSSINKNVGKAMNWSTSQKFIAKQLEKGYREPVKYAAKMMVASIVSKDLINTVIYVYQSYNNKEIPADKRKFIAAMDLVNGFINVFGQIASFMLIEKTLTPILQGKHYTGVVKDAKTGEEKYLYPEAPISSDNIHKLTVETLKEKEAELKKAGVDVDKAMKNIKSISKKVVKEIGYNGSKGKDIATGLSLLIGALGTMALVKRTITPLVSTPLAAKLSNRWERQEKEKNEKKENDHKLDILETEAGYQNNSFNNDKRPGIKKAIS